nr:histidine kinase [Microbacterium ulmi]
MAALFAAIVVRPELEAGRMVAYNALGTALVVVLFSAALGVRRLSPGLALTVAWAGALVQMAMLRPPSITDLAIFGVLYVTAAYGSRLVFWLGFASAVVGAGVIALYVFVTGGIGRSLSLQSLSLVAAILVASLFALLLSWTTGALVRTALRARENRSAQRQAEAETIAEQERTRIARDMHDVVAHSLAVVIAQADGARYAAASDPAAATEALGTISSTARSALADVRLLLTQLRHSQADGPQPTLADLEQLYAQVRAAGVDLRVDVDPAPLGEPPAAAQLAVYRILQEALTNALRHGDGGPVDVSLAWRPGRVELAVRNRAADGERAISGERGHGLIGMRERAQLAGGRLDAGHEGDRFVVRAAIPLGGAV